MVIVFFRYYFFMLTIIKIVGFENDRQNKSKSERMKLYGIPKRIR